MKWSEKEIDLIEKFSSLPTAKIVNEYNREFVGHRRTKNSIVSKINVIKNKFKDNDKEVLDSRINRLMNSLETCQDPNENLCLNLNNSNYLEELNKPKEIIEKDIKESRFLSSEEIEALLEVADNFLNEKDKNINFKEKYKHSSYRDFHIPISEDNITLKEALEIMKSTANEDYEVPLIIKLIENPEYDLPYIDIFHGAVDLYHHDCIHLLLGRGMLPKDEAFVIGFTMGSTNKVNIFEKMLFKFITKYIYKKPWNFTDDDIQILDMAVTLGHNSKVLPLDKIDFKSMEEKTLGEIRKELGLEVDMIKQLYQLEEKMFPNCKESIRNLK